MLSIHTERGEDFRFPITKFQFESVLNQCYTLQVDIHSDEELPAFSTLNLQPAHFRFTGTSGDPQWIHGYVTALDSHCLTIRPFLYLLHYGRQFKVWNGQSRMSRAKSLIDPLVKQLGRSASAVQWNVSDPLLTEADPRFVLQYADNDLASFEDLLQLSARYYFVQTETEEQLVIIDQPSFLEEQRQTFGFDPSKREAVDTSTPVFYECSISETDQPLTARPRYVDITTPAISRSRIQKEDPSAHEFNIYAPSAQYDLVQQHEQAQLNSGKCAYELGTYCNLLSIGQRFILEDADSGESVPLFLESLKVVGNLKSPLEGVSLLSTKDSTEEKSPLASSLAPPAALERMRGERGAGGIRSPSDTVGVKSWQFQVNILAREYAPDPLSFLAPIKLPQRAPGFIRGALIPELSAVSDLGQYEVEFPIDVVAGNPNPRVLMRDIQETATQGGGTSHSVTGKAEVLIASQDGLPSDWLIMGSLTNEGREATVTTENYRDSRIETGSGLAVHMRRTDETNPHGELGVHLANTQGKTAKLNLGTNNDLLTEAPDTHGTQVASTSYAKTLTSANHYTTVGDVDDPIHQTSLTKENGQIQSHKEINVAGGANSQIYWTNSPAVTSTSKCCNHQHAVSAHAIDPNTVVIEYEDGCTETRSGGSRAWRNNNPGNIEVDKKSPSAFGALGANGLFVIYPNEEVGFNAVKAWLQSPAYKHATLAKAIQKWAPPNENDTVVYEEHVQKWSHVPLDSPMSSLSQDQITLVAYAIRTQEGWKPGSIQWKKGDSNV